MNRTRFVVCLVAAITAAFGQDRITDEFRVNLSQEARVGDTILSPGEYRIRQLPTASSPRMLEFVDKQGNSIRTTISAIPALKNNGADKTVLQFERSNAGSIPYISHLWVEGKSYGYELPAPSDSTMTTATRTTTTTSDNSLRMEGSSRWAEPPAQVAQQTTPAPARVEEQPRPEPTPAPTPQPEPPAQVTAPEQPVAPATTAPAEDRLPTTADDTVAISILAGIALLCVGSATKLQKKRS